MTVAPLLVVGVGNPSRGDDALGPHAIERLGEALARGVAAREVELLTDYQLQIEHVLDLAGRARVVFVDASLSARAPFEHARVFARRDRSISTHAMSPEALLETFRATLGEPPEAWALAIRGERFELGEGLSEPARAHLDAAVAFLVAWLAPEGRAPEGRRFTLEGIVQGVGLRPFVARRARALGLGGEVRNTARGVLIDAFGPSDALDALVSSLARDAPEAARIRALEASPLAPRPAEGFVITASEGGLAPRMSLPPDLATCDACLRDLVDPASRFCGYFFTSCAECGPRLSIARALPYDRATTTMAGFALCGACHAEHACEEDRRFHAQTLACPACGPRVWLADPDGVEQETEHIMESIAVRLDAGEILGVLGLGALHLVCDATEPRAVAELRRRKRREAQPFAVMVADVGAAEALVVLDGAARAALVSPARPIVLAPSREGALPVEVSGRSRRAGVMLPYTPLHHALAARAGRPLVVTSGNLGGGPAVIERDEAVRRLGRVVDAFVLHDRPIERRVEDSVVAGGRVIRRSRGYVAAPIRLRVAAPEPVLAVGGHLKSTACLVVGDLAYMTPHLGDLGTVEAEAAWRRDVEGLEALLGLRAEVLAHDLHPDYAATRYALARPARARVGVQHHVAHVLAAVAEHRLDEPVVGLVLDGSGFGTDDTSWGAEVLVVDGGAWTRAATFRPLALPGGERAIREVWRAALAALVGAFGEAEALALAPRFRAFDEVPEGARATVARMIATGTSTAPARGMGRWFDAVGALALGLPRASFEGEVAIALEERATSGPVEPYPVDLGAEVDLTPAVRAIVLDLLAGVDPGTVAARFHEAIVRAASAIVARGLAETGLRRVVLAGGCLQNRTLERGLVARLGEARVVMGREVPVNDGGLALGQAYAAVMAAVGR
jgi:hydrogenase maturation protein HypF